MYSSVLWLRLRVMRCLDFPNYLSVSKTFWQKQRCRFPHVLEKLATQASVLVTTLRHCDFELVQTVYLSFRVISCLCGTINNYQTRSSFLRPLLAAIGMADSAANHLHLPFSFHCTAACSCLLKPCLISPALHCHQLQDCVFCCGLVFATILWASIQSRFSNTRSLISFRKVFSEHFHVLHPHASLYAFSPFCRALHVFFSSVAGNAMTFLLCSSAYCVLVVEHAADFS